MGGRAYTAAVAVLGGVVWACAASAGDATVILFSGADTWRQGSFLHGGLLYSPGGLERDGFTVRMVVSGGQYRYLSGALGNATVRGQETALQFMPGWRWRFGSTELKLFAGLDLQHHELRPDDPSSRLRGTQQGGRVGFELWTEPTATTMLAADGSVSSLANSYAIRGAAGVRVLERFYIGPEVQTFASGNYRQVRAGFHVTGLRAWSFEWVAGAGYVSDSDRHGGG